MEQKQEWMREKHSVSAPLAPSSPPCFTEQHFAPAELAQMWSLSIDLVRRLFEHESGVLVVGDATGTRSKRRYRTVRIPQSVAARVHQRLQRG